jgi:hypothetical protein
MENKPTKQPKRQQRQQRKPVSQPITPQAPSAASDKPVATFAPDYQPSKNEAAYTNLPPHPQWNYRIISFKNDYIKLQEDITKMLNTGWQLAGGVSTTMYADQYSVNTVFSQAVYKTK